MPGLVDLPQLVRGVAEAGLPVSLDVAPESPLVPVGVQLAAYRIVQEALTNTLRHSRALHATVRLETQAGSLRISVRDDGFGIEAQNQGQLFKRFARIETDANRHLVGMGIGLYLVEAVARAHGGRILVDSRAGAGSEFTLELPKRGAQR